MSELIKAIADAVVNSKFDPVVDAYFIHEDGYLKINSVLDTTAIGISMLISENQEFFSIINIIKRKYDNLIVYNDKLIYLWNAHGGSYDILHT